MTKGILKEKKVASVTGDIWLQLTETSDDYVMSGGSTGDHKLCKAYTDSSRLNSHWSGYIANNSPGAMV